MCTKKMMRRLFSAMLILVMVFCGIVNDVTKQAQAAVNKEGGTSADFTKCINVTEKYLYMGKSGVKTFDFNIRKEAMMKGATYIWYIRTDKGNPKAVSINKKTGIVTAREAGTAYIRCKITLADGSVYRPQAIVTVINNITAVGINNLPGDTTIIAGSGYDFNHSVLGTEAGKSAKTSGITGWEIADDTSGVETATAQGIVFPIKVGEFKVRAVCFSSTAKYKAWLSDKEANQAGITATSEWATIKVASSQGIATATTQEQLNKSLVADDIERIELSTDKAILLTIPRGNYDKKTLIVNTPNADIENHGIFKEIMIKAIKDSTWIEYANGNIVNLSDETASFVIKEGINVKRIVIDRADSQLNIVINGAVEQIVVLQPTSINLSGSGAQVPVTVEASAGGSAITASMPLDLELKAKTDVTLNEGAGDTSLNKSESTVVVKIQNNTDRDSVITTNHSDGESIGTGKTIISDGNKKTTEGTVVPINTPSGGPSTNPPTQPSTINVSAITVTSAGDATTVVNGGTLQMSATVAPANATNKTVTWSVINGTGSATISTNGLLTATGAGTVTIKAVANDGSLIQGNKAIIINTTALAKVTNAALGADGTATWSDVSNETSYDIQLLKDGVNQGAVVNIAANTTTTNLLTAMRDAGAGNYTFTVTAKGDGVYFVNGATSDASSSQTVLQLATVNAGLTWTGNVAQWTAVTSAVSYDVQLYKGSTAVGSAVNVLSANVATGTDFTAAMTTGGSGTYTYKVTAKGNTSLILDATSASVASNDNIKAASLAKVANAVLGADGTATWSDVSNESSYDIQLLKDGVNQGAVVNIAANTTTTNLLTAMRDAGAGNYTITVTAKGDGVYFVNGATSDASSSQTVLQLSTVNAGLTWTGNVAHWTVVTNAVSYDVQLYKGSTAVGSAVNVLTANVATGADFSVAIAAGGSGTYTYKVTAKGNTSLILDATAASVASNDNIKAASLAKVANAVLGADGIATWSDVSNESSYDIQLLKDGVNQGAVVNIAANTTTTNLLAAMRGAGAGNYTFTVTAKGDGVYFVNGATSDASSSQTVLQLATVNAGLTWTGDVAHWTVVTNAVSYDVQLYKGSTAVGSAVNVLSANVATGTDFTAAMTTGGSGTYTYKVTAKGNTTLILDATAASVASNDNIKAATLTKVTNAVLGADGIATWSDVSNEASYDIQLLKDGVNQGAVVNIAANTTTTNLLTAMRDAGAGNYTFTVTAKGDGVYFVNGATSDASDPRTIVQLATVNAGLTWTGDVAHWSPVANAVSYLVKLYKNGVYTGNSSNILAANAGAGADHSILDLASVPGTYTYTVTSMGNSTLIINAAESVTSNNNTKAASLAKVAGVAVGVDGTLSWTDVANETSYDIRLYKNGSVYGSVINVTADTTSINLLTTLRTAGVGAYTATVTAIGNGTTILNGTPSNASSARNVIQLATVSAGLSWSGNVAHWIAVTDAVSYDVQLYKAGTAVGTPVNITSANMTAGVDFTSTIAAEGVATYTYRVIAKGNTTWILDASVSAPSSNNIVAALAPAITGYSVAPGTNGLSTKVTYAQGAGNKLKYVKQAGAFTTPAVGTDMSSINGVQLYNSGGNINSALAGEHIGLYEYEQATNKVVKFVDITLASGDIAPATPLITGYTVAKGNVAGATRITYTQGSGNNLKWIRYSGGTVINPLAVGETDFDIQIRSNYTSGDNITGVTASDQILLYEVTAANTVVKYALFVVGAENVAEQIEGSASDSTVMMQVDNVTVAVGDKLEFTLTKGTLKDAAVLAAMDPTNVISFATLPAGMSYAVTNNAGKLVVTFIHAATAAVTEDITLNAVIKAAAVTEAGILNTSNIPVTIKNCVVTSVDSNYQYTRNGMTATIVDYLGSSTSLTIPSVIDGYTVVRIGIFAFNENNLTAITIPSNVIIDTWAFFNNSITSITIGSNVTIGDNFLSYENTNFRNAYASGGAGTYTGTQYGTWAKGAPLLSVGDSYEGGIIVYLLQPGDPGYNATVQHGLIAATEVLGDPDNGYEVVWSNTTMMTVGTSTLLGSGSTNTSSMIAQDNSFMPNAASVAQGYNGGGFSDWYLPSKDELEKMYMNKAVVGAGLFEGKSLWSSSEGVVFPDSSVWGVYHGDGLMSEYNKIDMFWVWPVKSF